MEKNDAKVRNRISGLPSPEKLTDIFFKRKKISFLNGSEEIEAVVTCLERKKDSPWSLAVKILNNSREFSHLEPGGFFFGHYNPKNGEGVLFSTVP